jgi:hypothetical protein
MAGPCEHGNEFSGSLNYEKSLDRLSDYQLVKQDCVAWSYLTSNFQKVSGSFLSVNNDDMGVLKIYDTTAHITILS